jgi:hypothetical protein
MKAAASAVRAAESHAAVGPRRTASAAAKWAAPERRLRASSEIVQLYSVSDSRDAGEQYVAVARIRGLPVAKPPRWNPLVLQRMSVSDRAVNVRISSAETCSSN